MSWVNNHISRNDSQYMLSSLGRKSADSTYSYKRLFSSVLVWVFVGAMMYTAAPYAAAYIPLDRVFNITDSIPNFRKITYRLTTKTGQERIYLRSGQTLNFYYSLPEGAKITLHVKRCKQTPVIEAFSCQIIDQNTLSLAPNAQGSYALQSRHTAMYYISETVTLSEGNTAQRHRDYDIIWRRK